MREAKAEDINELTDESLMILFAQGKDECFRPLYDRYCGRVLGFLNRKLRDRSLAEEVFQEVFIKLARSRSSFNSEGSFAPWLFSIVRSCMVDGIRANHRNLKVIEAVSINVNSEISERIEGPEDTDVWGILDTLSERDRTVITLRFIEDKSYEKIALIMQTSIANVRKIASRAISKIKKD